jgi:hypothetical protein
LSPAPIPCALISASQPYKNSGVDTPGCVSPDDNDDDPDDAEGVKADPPSELTRFSGPIHHWLVYCFNFCAIELTRSETTDFPRPSCMVRGFESVS